MATYRIFAYNPDKVDLEGMELQGFVSAGYYKTSVLDGYEWWNGPDEDSGYIISYVDTKGTVILEDKEIPCHISFFKSEQKTEASFLEIANVVSGQKFQSGSEAKTWLNSRGHWTSYIGPFISGWNSGSDKKITLPLVSTGTYDFIVDWGDGTTNRITSWNQSQKTHNYANNARYIVKIAGTIEGWSFSGAGDCQKLLSVSDWGTLKLGTEGRNFEGCSNLSLTNVKGVLDLKETTNLSRMFYNSSVSSIKNINYWNVSEVVNMSNMFTNTSFNSKIGRWDVDNVENMSGMFQSSKFNKDIGDWNVSKVSNMSGMFKEATNFNQNIKNWNISSVNDMSEFMKSKSNDNFSYYDDVLESWSSLNLKPSVVLDMGNIDYSLLKTSIKDKLENDYGWTIYDGGQKVDNPVIEDPLNNDPLNNYLLDNQYLDNQAGIYLT